jgi:hypothetical protein
MKTVLHILCWFLLFGTVNGQQLSAHWDRNNCLIGEQVILKIQVREAPKKVNYKPYSGEVPCELLMDSSRLTQNGTLEIIRTFSDTTYRKKGTSFWEGKYTLTAWDTGVYRFPRIQILIGDSLHVVQPAPLAVTFEKQTVKDNLIEVPVILDQDNWWWLKSYWWIGLFPLAAIIILIIRRRNIKRAPKRVLSLKERTQIALEALRKQAYWQKGMINEHYIEFSFILRSFLSARYNLNLMERTTYETILLLRTQEVPEPTLERIRRLLQESDMVKFAMGIPDEETILLGMTYLDQLIVELSPLELVQ